MDVTNRQLMEFGQEEVAEVELPVQCLGVSSGGASRRLFARRAATKVLPIDCR